MASNPRILATDTTVTSDGASTRFLKKGTMVDCPAGSPMETAYGGAGNLVNLSAAQAYSVGMGADQMATGN